MLKAFVLALCELLTVTVCRAIVICVLVGSPG